VSKVLPAHRKPHFLATAKMEALFALAPALPPAFYAIYEKIQAKDATAPARQLLATLARIQPNAADALERLDGVASGVTPAIIAVLCILAYAGYRMWAVHNREKTQEAASGPNQLIGPLLMLQETIMERKGLSQANAEHIKRFRCTLHRVEEQEHFQHLPYVGFSSDDRDRQLGPDRHWSNHCGIVGEVIRKGGTPGDAVLSQMLDNVKTPDDYVEALIEQHGYDRKQAKAHEPMRLASLAIPINDGNPSNVIAVLYCDSSDRDFFDPSTQELCVYAATAIAKHVKLLSN
jgi:hypothetical protein